MKFSIGAVLPSVAILACSLNTNADELSPHVEAEQAQLEEVSLADGGLVQISLGEEVMNAIDSTGCFIDSMGNPDPACPTDSMGSVDDGTVLTLPYHAEKRDFGVWIIKRDTVADGELLAESLEQVCVKLQGNRVVGSPVEWDRNQVVWGKVKNAKEQIVVHFSADEVNGGDKPVHMTFDYNPDTPNSWTGTWFSKDQSGDAHMITLRGEDEYHMQMCPDAAGWY
ncbi:MAG: hypothetical protein ACI8WB_000459 [Phenylobacterium sp.]|jgi:hypothetical protein